MTPVGCIIPFLTKHSQKKSKKCVRHTCRLVFVLDGLAGNPSSILPCPVSLCNVTKQVLSTQHARPASKHRQQIISNLSMGRNDPSRRQATHKAS